MEKLGNIGVRSRCSGELGKWGIGGGGGGSRVVGKRGVGVQGNREMVVVGVESRMFIICY